ncbi:MAG: transporter [Prevotella sp.]|nr:transporter [Prevotella sp.]
MVLRFLRNWTLPVAITVGTLSYLLFYLTPALDGAGDVLGRIFDTIFPLSVFSTLFVTFCKVDFHQMRPHRWHLGVLLVQIVLTAVNVAAILLLHSHLRNLEASQLEGQDGLLLLEAVLTCVIAPSATAAPVIVGKLGGNISTMSAFTVISSFAQALIIPVVFPLLEPSADLSFWAAFLVILRKLALVLLLPLLLGWTVQHTSQRLHLWIASKPNLSFYCWAFSLAITAGITVKNIVHSEASFVLLAAIALATLVVCFVQYALGRGVGHWLGEPLNSGQALFQKNTALSIWVSYIYLNPVASVGAGCYVLWQNVINSLEIWQYQRKQNICLK